MSLSVYNAERFERGILWYIVGGALFAILLFLTLFGNKLRTSLLSGQYAGEVTSWLPGWTDVLSAGLLVLLLLGYWMYALGEENVLVPLSINEQALRVGKRTYPLGFVQGFSFEKDGGGMYVKNLVIHTHKSRIYHTIAKNDDVLPLADMLGQYIPFIEERTPTFLEKATKKCKI